MVFYRFMEVTKKLVDVPETAIGTSFSGSVVHFFRNGKTFCVVLYGLLEVTK